MITSILILTRAEDFDLMLRFLLGVVFQFQFQMLWLHVTFGFMDQLKWKRADPQTPQHLCLSLLLWFTDTDLAEPILLVILYWICSPGGGAYGPLLSSPGLQTEQDIHAWAHFLFTNSYETFAATKTVSRLRRQRLKGPCLRRSLFAFCLQELSKLTNADRQIPRMSVHGGCVWSNSTCMLLIVKAWYIRIFLQKCLNQQISFLLLHREL